MCSHCDSRQTSECKMADMYHVDSVLPQTSWSGIGPDFPARKVDQLTKLVQLVQVFGGRFKFEHGNL